MMTIHDQFNAAWASREWGLWGIDDEACARYWFEKGYREALEKACAAIKAEDDRTFEEDYMLDSNDCIAVIRALVGKEEE